MRVPLRRARMGRAANSAALPLGSDWSSCSCRLPRSRFSHLGGSRVCAAEAPGVCAAAAGPVGRRSAVDRPKRDQEGGSAFVRIRLLWRLAKRAKRLSKTQNVTTP